MTFEERKKIITAYHDMFSQGNYHRSSKKEDLQIINTLEAMGWGWGHKISFHDFRITNGDYYITNSGTGYKPEANETYVHWDNGNVGRLQFVSSDYYYDVKDEWQEFKTKLMSYNPVDFDPLNDHIVYAAKDGAKLIEDYHAILKDFRKKFGEKVRKAKYEKAKADLAKIEEEIKQW